MAGAGEGSAARCAALAAALAIAAACTGEIAPIDSVASRATSGAGPGAGGASDGSTDPSEAEGDASSTSGPGSSGSSGAMTSGHAGAGSAGQGGSGATTGSGGPSGTGSGSGSGGSTTSASSGAGGASGECAGGAPPADPTCYWEPVCPDASLDDLAKSYSPAKWLSTTLEMTARRYPGASCLLSMYPNDLGNYADTGSFGSLAESLMTMTHEETHGYDYEHALWGKHFAYWVRCDLALQTTFLDGFGRGEILSWVEGSATSLYDSTYLTGQQGTYGWVELLDEWNAYINGMAAIALVGDHVPAFGISGTDGALAFAYYVELYLAVARTTHPSVYAQIEGDASFRGLLRLQWNRMHFFLELAAPHENLSIHADEIAKLVYAPENLSELEDVLGIPLSPSPCN